MMRRRFTLMLVLSLVTLPATVHGDEPNPASEAYEKGTRLFKELDYRGAIEAFQESYRLKPHYLSLCNVARCYERLNDLVQAADTYRRCLEQGGGGSNLAEQLRTARARVEARITRVRVSSKSGGGTIFIDGKAVGNTPKEVPLNPGTHLIEVRQQGARPASTTIETRGGAQTVVLTPMPYLQPTKPGWMAERKKKKEKKKEKEKEPRRHGISQTWFWTSAGLTVALAAAGAVLGALTIKANQDFEDAPTWKGHDKVLDYRLATNILFGAAAAAAGASAVLFFYTDFGGRERADEEAGLSVLVGLRGRF